MNHTYLRGDMYYADLGRGIGSEQEGYRPVVIIQNNVGNKHSPTVIIASITSKTGVKAKLPTHYYIDAEDGLELPSIVLLEQLRTVDKRRLGNFIGHLSEKHICGINHALAVSIGLIESVPKKLILCLCSTCADNFYGTGAYYLRRIDPVQVAKDTCTYCNQRKGGGLWNHRRPTSCYLPTIPMWSMSSRCVKCSVASAIKLPINSCAPVRSGALSLAVTIVFRS